MADTRWARGLVGECIGKVSLAGGNPAISPELAETVATAFAQHFADLRNTLRDVLQWQEADPTGLEALRANNRARKALLDPKP